MAIKMIDMSVDDPFLDKQNYQRQVNALDSSLWPRLSLETLGPRVQV